MSWELFAVCTKIGELQGKLSICSQNITIHIFVGHRMVYWKCVRKSSFYFDYIQQLFRQNPYRTVRLTRPTTRVHPDESQEALFVANYICILPVTPGPYATKEFNFFLKFRI
jgi:hypothetical protein